MKTNENEILTIAGKRVVVRYTRDCQPCEKCVFGESDNLCAHAKDKCVELDRVGMEIDERAYFVEAEQPEEEAPAREANPFVPDQGLTIDGKRYEKRYFRIGDACSRCAFKVGEDAKGHARCKDHGKPEKPCTPDREKGVLVYFIAADQLQEEIHSLQEWAKIMAERPDLRAEFDKMCPPQPIRGSIGPEVDLGARMLAHFRRKTKPTWCNIPVKDIIDYLEGVSATKEIDFEEAVYKAFGQVKDFTLAIRIARYFYNLNPKHK